MTDERDDIEPDTEAEKEPQRPDPRLRPPDPAGTQPQWDPQELLPQETPLAASGRLWAPPHESDGDADAGAPAGDGEHVMAAAAAAGAPAGVATGSGGNGAAAGEDDEAKYSKYSGRFQFLLGALLAVGAAAIVLLVAALVSDDQSSKTITVRTGPAWSKWKPASPGGVDAAQEIAEHVAHEYRLPNGQQLVSATGGALEIENLPITVAIQRSVKAGGDIDFVDGVGVLYRLCGLGGTNCRIPYAKPSVNRHLLLKREALELALYSFRYLGVEQAVVFMPPSTKTAQAAGGKSTKPTPEALLFRRDDPEVAAALAHPLDATLAKTTPSIKSVTRSPDARTVKSLTQPNTFSFRLQPSNQDARAFLVLHQLTD